ncbi:hypothetical protein QJQ45_009067 [Haematococcus lacustris]|nr:hypothetical protein QJQ45_009067 [Haematococcus lacustris]
MVSLSAPCSQLATQAAASEPEPSTPLLAKRVTAEKAAELNRRTKAPKAAKAKAKGKGKGKAAKAKPAPQPGRWLDRDCNAALNMQRIGESKWRPLELCYWPDQGALPAKGKEYPGLGYKRRGDNRGHQGISQAVFDYIRHYYHEHSKPSPSCKDQRSYRVCQTAGDDERTLVNETRRFFESSLLVMWLEFDDEQQHLEEQWRQNQHQQGGQLQQPPSMRNKQMPEYIKHHRLAHHQLQVFREHCEAVKAGQDQL